MINTPALRKLTIIRRETKSNAYEKLYILGNGNIVSTDGDISIFFFIFDDPEVIKNEGKVLCKAEIRKKKEGEEIKIREMNKAESSCYWNLKRLFPISDSKKLKICLDTKFLKYLLENFKKNDDTSVIFEVLAGQQNEQFVNIFSESSDNKAVIMSRILQET